MNAADQQKIVEAAVRCERALWRERAYVLAGGAELAAECARDAEVDSSLAFWWATGGRVCWTVGEA